MYAIIEHSGGQRRVTQGETIWVDLIEAGNTKPGDAVTFDKILVIGETGGSAKIGVPYVAGASVAAKILEPVVKGEKLDIHKFKPKTGYRRKTGHRQRYTAVEITSIQG